MLHMGDITKINGYEVPIVDVVIGGSPCQGLSVAGKQLGLQDERSGLFMEQIRIVKEMREHDRRNGTDTVRPRYMVWENVPGATATGNPKGEDFRIVLEEISKIADSQISIPRPADGKWANAGCIIGDNFSIAWRIMDGQWWGVPQRRRRIHLVADFNRQTAPEIVFGKEYYQCDRSTDISDTDTSVGHIGDESRPEIHAVSQGLSRNTESCRETWTSASEDAERSSATDDSKRTYGFDGHNGYITDEVSSTIGTNCGMVSGRNGVIEITDKAKAFRKKSHPMNSEQPQVWEEAVVSETLNTFENTDARTPTLIVDEIYAVDMGGGKSACDILNRITDYTGIVIEEKHDE